MRSASAYYKKTEMPDVQRRYFYRLLNEHLETHYRIMDEFDTDKARASARRREFDAYLKAEMRDLYLKWAIARFSLRFRRRESRKTPGGIKKQLKHFIKMFLPYGMIRFYQKEHYGF